MWRSRSTPIPTGSIWAATGTARQAVAQPERGVIALEGDGSLLMALGCLATIANLKPRNLTIVVIGISVVLGTVLAVLDALFAALYRVLNP